MPLSVCLDNRGGLWPWSLRSRGVLALAMAAAVGATAHAPLQRLLRPFSMLTPRRRVFYDKRMCADVPGDSVAEQFKGYVFKITGGNDKQGFPMKQGVLLPHRVRLLLSKGHSCYRPRRAGERKRKSVRGCIVGPDISSLSLTIVKKGDADIDGLTNRTVAKRLGPKRATKIRKMFVRDCPVSFSLLCFLCLLWWLREGESEAGESEEGGCA